MTQLESHSREPTNLTGIVSLVLLCNLENLLQVLLLLHIFGVLFVIEPIVHVFHGRVLKFFDSQKLVSDAF